MEDIESKYSALSFEFSRLRARFQTLRQYYMNSRTKTELETDENNVLKRRIKRLELEIDGLNFRNEHFVKRISFLQNEISQNEGNGSQIVKNADKNVKNDRKSAQNLNQGLDFFIETTKSQLSAIMMENEQLSQKIYELQSQIEVEKKAKVSEVEELVSENIKLKNKVSVQNFPFNSNISNNNYSNFNISNFSNNLHINNYDLNNDNLFYTNSCLSFSPTFLPRTILQNLESTYHNCLLKLYISLSSFFTDIYDCKLFHNFHNNSSIIQTNFQKLKNWIDLPTENRSRIKDSIFYISKINITLNITISIFKYILYEYSSNNNYFIIYLSFIKKCLLEFIRIFQCLQFYFPSKEVKSIENIENLLLFLRERISDYSQNIENLHCNLEEIQFNNLIDIFRKYQIDLSKSLFLLNMVVDNELSILRLYGWFPLTFNSYISQNNNICTFISSYKDCMESCGKINQDCFSAPNVPDSPSNTHLVSSEVIKTFDEYKNVIHNLKKENEKLYFELKAHNLLASNKCDGDDENSKFINYMKEYLDSQISHYHNENQELSSQIVHLKSDLSYALNRIRANQT